MQMETVLPVLIWHLKFKNSGKPQLSCLPHSVLVSYEFCCVEWCRCVFMERGSISWGCHCRALPQEWDWVRLPVVGCICEWGCPKPAIYTLIFYKSDIIKNFSSALRNLCYLKHWKIIYVREVAREKDPYTLSLSIGDTKTFQCSTSDLAFKVYTTLARRIVASPSEMWQFPPFH